MDIDVPLRELGAIDTTALREAILGQEDVAWHEDEYRQISEVMGLRTDTVETRLVRARRRLREALRDKV